MHTIELTDRDKAATAAGLRLLRAKLRNGEPVADIPDDYSAEQVGELHARVLNEAGNTGMPAGDAQPVRPGDINETIRDRPGERKADKAAKGKAPKAKP